MEHGERTPGTWVPSTSPDYFRGGAMVVRAQPTGETGPGIVVAVITRTPHAEANRALLSAAPDLYRELHHLVTLLREQERDGFREVPGLATLNGARAALAKARGET